MNKNIALLATVSAIAFATTANALEFRPYVGAQYNYTKVDAEEVEPKLNSGSVLLVQNTTNISARKFFINFQMMTQIMV